MPRWVNYSHTRAGRRVEAATAVRRLETLPGAKTGQYPGPLIALQSRSATFIRMCGTVVALVGILLVVIATRAGNELLRLAGGSG